MIHSKQCHSSTVISGVVAAQTAISGNIGGMVLDSSGNPFIVEKTSLFPKVNH